MAFCRKVHVTGQTLELLHGEFEFENGTVSARNDPFLIKNNIQTYLISPPKLKVDVTSSRLYCNRIFKCLRLCLQALIRKASDERNVVKRAKHPNSTVKKKALIA